MNSITQKNKKENRNTKRYLPHDLKTKIHAVETYRNNGKVERSYRNDNGRFYSCLKFYSLEDWIKQGKAY